MMLTQMFLNPQRRGARKLLGSPQAMHAAVLSGFPPGAEPGRVLWRVDGAGSPRTVLWIVSAEAPDLAHLEEQAGWPSRPTGRSIHYDGLLNRLAEGQRWGFRLDANPVHRLSAEDGKRIVGHVTAEQQVQWLLDRQDVLGIGLTDADGQRTVEVISRDVKKFRREGATVTLATATFSGILDVRDPGRLRDALVQGVGRGKAYGCGLLTLARP